MVTWSLIQVCSNLSLKSPLFSTPTPFKPSTTSATYSDSGGFTGELLVLLLGVLRGGGGLGRNSSKGGLAWADPGGARGIPFLAHVVGFLTLGLKLDPVLDPPFFYL